MVKTVIRVVESTGKRESGDLSKGRRGCSRWLEGEKTRNMGMPRYGEN